MSSARVGQKYEAPKVPARRPMGNNNLGNPQDRLCLGRAAPRPPAAAAAAPKIVKKTETESLLIREPVRPSPTRPFSASAAKLRGGVRPKAKSNLVSKISTYHPKPVPAAVGEETVRNLYKPIPRMYTSYEVKDNIKKIFKGKVAELRTFRERIPVVLPPAEPEDPRDYQKKGTLQEREERRNAEYLKKHQPSTWQRAAQFAEAQLPTSFNSMTVEQGPGAAMFQLDHLPVEEDVDQNAKSVRSGREYGLQRSPSEPVVTISTPDRTPSPTGPLSANSAGVQMKYVYSPVKTSCLVSGSQLEELSRNSVSRYHEAKKAAQQVQDHRRAEKEEQDRLEFEDLLNPDKEQRLLKKKKKEAAKLQKQRARRIAYGSAAHGMEPSRSESRTSESTPTPRHTLTPSRLSTTSAESSDDEDTPPATSSFEDTIDANKLILRTPWVIDVSVGGSRRKEREKFESVLDRGRGIVVNHLKDACTPLTELLDAVESQIQALAGGRSKAMRRANPAPLARRRSSRSPRPSPRASPRASPMPSPMPSPSSHDLLDPYSLSPPAFALPDTELSAPAPLEHVKKLVAFDPRLSLPFSTITFQDCTITGSLLQYFFDSFLPLTHLMERMQKLKSQPLPAPALFPGTKANPVDQLPTLQNSTILLSLSFKNCTLDEEVLSLIGTVFKSTYKIGLAELHVHRCCLPGGGTPTRISEVLHLHRSTLESLQWRSTFLSSSVFSSLCSFVSESKRLRELDVGHCGVTAKDEVLEFCAALRDTHCPLELLNVDSMPLPQGVGGRFVAAIQEIVAKGSLEESGEWACRLKSVSTRYCEGTTSHFQEVIRQCIDRTMLRKETTMLSFSNREKKYNQYWR